MAPTWVSDGPPPPVDVGVGPVVTGTFVAPEVVRVAAVPVALEVDLVLLVVAAVVLVRVEVLVEREDDDVVELEIVGRASEPQARQEAADEPDLVQLLYSSWQMKLGNVPL